MAVVNRGISHNANSVWLRERYIKKSNHQIKILINKMLNAIFYSDVILSDEKKESGQFRLAIHVSRRKLINRTCCTYVVPKEKARALCSGYLSVLTRLSTAFHVVESEGFEPSSKR